MAKNKKPQKSAGSDSERSTAAVGYKKPPAEHRFKPGTSGNPNGRPKKKELSLTQYLSEVLQKKVTIRVNGSSQELPAVDAIAMRIVELGLKGDHKIINLLMRQDMRKQEISREEEKRPQGGVLLVPVMDPATWEIECEKLRENYPILRTNTLEAEPRSDAPSPAKRR